MVSFKHKGLKLFWGKNDYSKLKHAHIKKVTIILQTLHVASTIEDMKRPSFKLHELTGNLKGRYSVWVNGNWRITFLFINGDAEIIDYEDYH